MKAASIVNEAYLRRASVTCEMSSCHILAAVAALDVVAFAEGFRHIGILAEMGHDA